METFSYKNGILFAEGVSLAELAERRGTPAFVYSRTSIENNWRRYADAFHDRSPLICYAVKANSNIAILNLLARLGSGFDIVSVGELERVLRAGGEPGKIVFSGVGKRRDELVRALQAGIKCFNVESEAELLRLDEIARGLSVQAPVSVRVNPDVNPQTHPYIATGLRENKFGIEFDRALAVYQRLTTLENLTPVGIDCHIGSQITSIAPYTDAVKKLLSLADQLEDMGVPIKHVDIGGGLGIRYKDETGPDIEDFAGAMKALIPEHYEIILEPGRSIVGNAGVLLTRVEYLKTNNEKNFAIVDAAMNDLLRPSLYQAWQDIVPVAAPAGGQRKIYDIAGPVCESGDFLGLQRELALGQNDLLAVLSAGAYGFSMSSNYNSRPRAVELLVHGKQEQVIRLRESVEQLMAGESLVAE